MAEHFTFTANQQRAIAHGEGPMLVVAGAGSGKTRVLTERVRRLIAEGLAEPQSILALTFTDKAAAQLRQRVADALPEGTTPVTAHTFHSYCNHLLAAHGRAFEVIDETDLLIYLNEHIEEMPLKEFTRAADPAAFLRDLLNFISRCQDDLYRECDYAAFVENLERDQSLDVPRCCPSKQLPRVRREQMLERCREVAEIYQWVERHLRDNGWGTYGNMIMEAVALLEQQPQVLAAERERIRYILVDEFQDSNYAQLRLIELLAGTRRNVFAVGDPDQAIYRFRGASAEAFTLFQRAFPKTGIIDLDTNFRSSPEILQTAFAALDRNPPADIRVSGKEIYKRHQLICGREAVRKERFRPTPVRVLTAPNGDSEAAAVAAEISTLLEHDPDTRCAILIHSHSHRAAVMKELARKRIPADAIGMDLLDTAELRDLVSLILALDSRSDSVALFRVCALPQFRIDIAQLRELLVAARKERSLIDILRELPGGRAVLDQLDAARARYLTSASAAMLPAIAAFDQLVRQFALPASPPLDAFREFLVDWMRKPVWREKNFAAFTRYLRGYLRFGKPLPQPLPAARARVEVLTIHKAKGLEFPHVFVLRVTPPSFPANFREPLFEFPAGLSRSGLAADQKTMHQQEQRRLFYVAMTRACDSLTLLTGVTRIKKNNFACELAQDKALKRVVASRDLPLADIGAAAATPLSPVSQWVTLPPRPELAHIRLSAGALETYQDCPLRFKIERDLGLTGEPGGSLHFGNAIHSALKGYFDGVAAGATPSLDSLLTSFTDIISKATFDTDHQRGLFLKQGITQLTVFYESRRTQPAPRVLATEKWFETEIAGHIVVGRIDRMDDLGNNDVAIEDYKTGRAKDQSHADKSLQLTVYALAARNEGKHAKTLALYSLQDNATIISSRTEEQLAEAVETIRQVGDDIAAGHFEPNPGYNCRGCRYRRICPAQESRALTFADAAVH